MYRALVFDIGNTLVKTVDLIESTYLEVFARHSIPAEKIKLFKQFAGRPKNFLFEEALGAVPDKAQRRARVHEGVRDDPGEQGGADRGDARRLRMPADARRPRLAHCHRERVSARVGTAILGRFGWNYPVVCDEDVREHRPAPDPVLKACELLGVAAAETIVVGDTPQDVLSAKAAGACSIAVTTGKFTGEELAEYRPTFIIPALTELPGLLQREFASSPAPR